MVSAAVRDDLYAAGKAAYEAGSYGTALKNLYAFYVLNQAAINSNEEFKDSLTERIKISESKIQIALHTTAIKGPDGRSRIMVITNATGGIIGTGKEIQDRIDSGELVIKNLKEILKNDSGR